MVVAEEVVAGETTVPLPSLRVEDPELCPPPRRAVPVAGDRHLRPLADDVAAQPDPRSAGELETNTGRLGHGGRQAGSQTRWLEGDEERLGAAGEGGEATEPIGDAGGGRTPVLSQRQVDDEKIDRSTGEEGTGDRQALVHRLRGQDDKPVEADAAGDGFDRIESAGQIEPGDDRPVDLGLRREPEGESRLARARIAPERDARTAWQAARPEDRIECRKTGPNDPLHALGAGKRQLLATWFFIGEWLVGERSRRQRPDHPRSCRAPACLEGRQSSRHIRGKRRHQGHNRTDVLSVQPRGTRPIDPSARPSTTARTWPKTTPGEH